MALERCEPWDESQSNTCPLAEACARNEIGPLLGRAAITGTPCWKFEIGSNCGLATAYFEAALLTLELNTIDQESPITHFSQVIETPEGEAPLEIREAIKGVRFHVRQNLQPPELAGQAVFVHPLDLILALHDNGKFKEANWYQKYAAEQRANGNDITGWHFRDQEMRTWENLIDRPTANEYGAQAWTLKGLLIWTGYVLPPELFKPESKDGKLFFEVLQGYADEMYGGDLKRTLLEYISDKFENGSFMARIRRSNAPTVTFDGDSNLAEVYEGGVAIYDKALGIDFRDNPKAAPKFELPFNERVQSTLKSRKASIQPT